MSLGKILVSLYRILSRRRWVLYLFLILITGALAFGASGIIFTEDPLQLFPSEGEGAQSVKAFSRLRAKDKIIVFIGASEEKSVISADTLADAADSFRRKIQELYLDDLLEYRESDGTNNQSEILDFIYNNLPLYLEEDDYRKIELNIEKDRVSDRLQSAMAMLISPAGAVASDMISRDPLFLGTHIVAKLDSLRMGVKMNYYRDNVFSEDWSSLFFALNPSLANTESALNEMLVKSLESAEKEVEEEFKEVNVMISGAPLASIYNARVIKRDTIFTSSLAMLMIVLLFWLSFRSFRTLLTLILPALFGALFALFFMALRGEPVSAIAVGAGATVMGIALSYSIHVISHLKQVNSVEELIDELAYPLTVGGFTTIGAFVGLLFTNSRLLQDFGLFSSLTLTGTTLFSLIFLPHFIKVDKSVKETKFYSSILRITSFQYEKVKWIRWTILALFIAGLFLASGVKFDSDFSNLGYEPKSHQEAQSNFSEKFGGGESRVFLLSTSNDFNLASEAYFRDNQYLDSLSKTSKSIKSASLSWLLPPKELQLERIERWNDFWSQGRALQLVKKLSKEGQNIGFSEDAFSSFYSLLNREYKPVDLSLSYTSLPFFVKEWIEEREGVFTFITQLYVSDNEKEKLYSNITDNTEFDVLDRAHFSSVWALNIKEDFNLILVISSLLVFITLLISYGRIELALMAFLPMAVSWIIILGLMNILGIEFNIFNILLATFIFGIGDDFSIFVLDGLSAEYQGKAAALASHKSAIFFSTFTVLAGVGSMAFATHPALKSIALVSIVGISSVWLVANTIQPIVYRFFITSPASKALHPYTFSGVAQMLMTFSAFLTGCILSALLIPVLILFPVKHSTRLLIFRKIIRVIVFLPVRLSPTVKIFRENNFYENFNKPAVIISNHQSFIDILMLLSLHPKIIMMTNKWVWNSPVFGHLVRFAGFIYHKDGIEKHIDSIRPKIEEGYSLLIFPEGTRSKDMEIHRFHKGAFKIAEELSLDILPVVIYGNGNLVSKQQPFYVKRGVIGYRILKRISYDSIEYGTDYRDRSKALASIMRNKYSELRSLYDTTSNLFFYQKVMSGYIYKGPVIEWYLRIKMRMENYYAPFHKMIPIDASVTDIGCGYGPLCFMLGVLSPKRVITGIDYDKEKIEIAKGSWLASENINFIHSDALKIGLPKSDVVIMNDVIHYLLPEEQELLIHKAIQSLNFGGFIILRDGDSEKIRYHRITRLSEWFSINVLGFNKAKQSPCFTSSSKIRSIASKYNCMVEEMRNDRVTSNTIYLLKPDYIANENL